MDRQTPACLPGSHHQTSANLSPQKLLDGQCRLEHPSGISSGWIQSLLNTASSSTHILAHCQWCCKQAPCCLTQPEGTEAFAQPQHPPSHNQGVTHPQQTARGRIFGMGFLNPALATHNSQRDCRGTAGLLSTPYPHTPACLHLASLWWFPSLTCPYRSQKQPGHAGSCRDHAGGTAAALHGVQPWELAASPALTTAAGGWHCAADTSWDHSLQTLPVNTLHPSTPSPTLFPAQVQSKERKEGEKGRRERNKKN